MFMSFDEDWLRRSRSEQQVELEATWIYQIDPARREVVNTRIAQGLIPILEIDGGYEVKWLGRLNRIHGRGESRRCDRQLCADPGQRHRRRALVAGRFGRVEFRPDRPQLCGRTAQRHGARRNPAHGRSGRRQ